jgi:aminoglycoside phosphotransferase (APT) family kinase protein
MAGELLAKLHALPPGPWFGIMDEQGQPCKGFWHHDPAVHYSGIVRRFLAEAQAAACLDADEERIARELLESLPATSFSRPVPTFYDFTPGNWIVGASGEFLGIIDFENMAWGLAADPFSRLVIDYFPECSSGREAFYAGYGPDAQREFPELVLIGCVTYALFYTAVAASHGSTRDRERARRGFEVCRQIRRQLGFA